MANLIKNMIKANAKDALQVSSASATLIIAQNPSREKLLRSAVMCATSLNEEKIQEIAMRLGEISYDDFLYIDELISSSNTEKSKHINAFLCENLKGFKQEHNIYYYALNNL